MLTLGDLDFAVYVSENLLIKEKFQELERHLGNNMNYVIGDFLIKVKNASMARNIEVTVGKTKLILALTKVLAKEKFIESYTEDNGNLTVKLLYQGKDPTISDIKLASKPGLRVYVSADDLGAKRGPETWILSTPKGILSEKEAKKERVGGELLCKIW